MSRHDRPGRHRRARDVAGDADRPGARRATKARPASRSRGPPARRCSGGSRTLGLDRGAVPHARLHGRGVSLLSGQGRRAAAIACRPPTRSSAAAATSHAEVAILRPRLVIPVGKLAIEQLFPDVDKLIEIVGTQQRATLAGHTFDVIALPHPSGASTWHRTEPGKTLLVRALVADRAARGVAVAARRAIAARAARRRARVATMTVAELLAELVAIPDPASRRRRRRRRRARAVRAPRAAARARAAPTRSIVDDAPRTDGSAGRVRVRALGHAAPRSSTRTSTPCPRTPAGRAIRGRRTSPTAGSTASAPPTPRARSRRRSSRSSARKPRDVGVLFSGDEEAGSARDARVPRVAARARRSARSIVCEPTARTAGIAHRGVLAQRARRSRAAAATRRRPTTCPSRSRSSRGSRSRSTTLGARRLHDGPPGMTGTVPQRRRAPRRRRVQRDPAARRARVVAAALPRLRSRRLGSRGRRARRRDRSGDHDRDDDRSRAVRVRRARRRSSRPFVRAIGPLDFWTEAALCAAHGIDAIVIGPGDIAQAHAADEFVALDDLDWAVELLPRARSTCRQA